MCLNPKYIVRRNIENLVNFNGNYYINNIRYNVSFTNQNDVDNFNSYLLYIVHNSSSDTLKNSYTLSSFGEVQSLFMQVDCRKCIQCRIKSCTSYKIRSMFQSLDYPISYMVTLTYDNEHLPKNGVSKDDVQKFFKRLRKIVDCKYILCSEYGETTFRPHYHAIIFFKDELMRDTLTAHKVILSAWSYKFNYGKNYKTNIEKHSYIKDALLDDKYTIGNILVKPMKSLGAFNYVTKYMYKGSFVPVGKNPNFHLQSKSLGLQGFKQSTLYQSLSISPKSELIQNFNGKLYKFKTLPKYFVDKLFRPLYKILKPRTSVYFQNLVDDLQGVNMKYFDTIEISVIQKFNPTFILHSLFNCSIKKDVPYELLLRFSALKDSFAYAVNNIQELFNRQLYFTRYSNLVVDEVATQYNLQSFSSKLLLPSLDDIQ